MQLAPTPKDVLQKDGTSRLYRFRGGPAPRPMAPLLLVPSMINRWYVLDLRAGSSLAASLTEQGIPTYCLDWGIAEDEDRYLSWEDVVARLGRTVRAVKRETGAASVGLLGYCMGGTLAGIYSALHPSDVRALINLAGPFDFAKGGLLADMVQAPYFDADAVADAGNVAPMQMQSGFTAMRPTASMSKWLGAFDRALDPKARESFEALEAWASDNIPFPGEAYRTYIRELYQQNLLVQGRHHVAGKRVDLGEIRCPVLTIVTERDTICPPAAATALNDACGSDDKQVITVPGGHVGAVVGSRASKFLYPAIASWLFERLGTPIAQSAEAPIEA